MTKIPRRGAEPRALRAERAARAREALNLALSNPHVSSIPILQSMQNLNERIEALELSMSSAQSEISALDDRVSANELALAELQKAHPFALFRLSSAANINAAAVNALGINETAYADPDTFETLPSLRIRCLRSGTYLFHGALSYQSTTAFVGLSFQLSRYVPGPTTSFLGGAESLVGGASAPISTSRFLRALRCEENDEFGVLAVRHASATGAAYLVGNNTHVGVIRLGDNR